MNMLTIEIKFSSSSLSLCGCKHLTVKHKLNFLDPMTQTTTNYVESLLCRAKIINKIECGTHRTSEHPAAEIELYIYVDSIENSKYNNIIITIYCYQCNDSFLSL